MAGSHQSKILPHERTGLDKVACFAGCTSGRGSLWGCGSKSWQSFSETRVQFQLGASAKISPSQSQRPSFPSTKPCTAGLCCPGRMCRRTDAQSNNHVQEVTSRREPSPKSKQEAGSMEICKVQKLQAEMTGLKRIVMDQPQRVPGGQTGAPLPITTSQWPPQYGIS